jgi:hypothetical protein
LSIYKNITCLENFYLKWTSIQPHAFLHAGFLSNLITKNNLNSQPAISIGMNLIQESILVKNNNLFIDVYDIDKPAIEAATKATIRMKIENRIKYKFENILVTEKLENKKYSLAILSQMDYIFDDEEIEKLALIFSENNINDIFILTPSVFQINLNPTKLIEVIFKFLYSLRSLIKNKNKENTYRTYTRNITHLKKLFSKFYDIKYQTDYRYPSGRIFLFHLKKILG